MENEPLSVSSRKPAGAKLEIADMITTRILSILKTDLEKADLLTAVDVSSRLSDLLSSSWRQSWKDGQNWKEKIWKDGNCSKAELVSNPAERIARLEQVISELRAAPQVRR